MRRSLFQLLDHHPERGGPPGEAQAQLVARARRAEELGFDTFWLAEHHFQRLGTIPNPAVALAALAAATRRIRLGSAVSVLPLRDPVQVAEDYALVDAFSGGRLNLGVGTGGQPLEFAGFGLDFEERGALFDERLRRLDELWSSAGSDAGDTINVRPVQSRAPLFVATITEERARQLGRDGRSLLTIVTPATAHLGDVERILAAHASGLRDGGHASDDAEAVTFVFSHVADDDDEARDIAAPALGRILGLLLGVDPPDGEPVYDMMRERGTGVFGSPDAAAKVLAHLEGIGARHVSFLTGFGGISADEVGRSMELLAPVYRRRDPMPYGEPAVRLGWRSPHR